MVPLVFKTSLGAVRSPEGSTPSLLRHKNTDKMNYPTPSCGEFNPPRIKFLQIAIAT